MMVIRWDMYVCGDRWMVIYTFVYYFLLNN